MNRKGKVIIVAVAAVILSLAAVGFIVFSYAYQYHYLGSFEISGSGCSLNPYGGNCMGVATTNGTVVSTSSTLVSGWFFGLGSQTRENVTVFVPILNVNFTQAFLGCGSGHFRKGETVFLLVGAYNTSQRYTGVPYGSFQETNLNQSQVLNPSYGNNNVTVTYTLSSSTFSASGTLTKTTIVHEIGRGYSIFPVPTGCKLVGWPRGAG